MFKVRHLLNSTMLATALLAVSPQAFAITAEELKTKLAEDIKLPFSMAILGPLNGANITVEGEGPFQVSIEGGMIDGNLIPTISFDLSDEGSVYKIENASLAGELNADIKGMATLGVANLAWSGTWDVEKNDYVEFSNSSDGVSLGATDFPISLEFGTSSASIVQPDGSGEMASSVDMQNIDLKMDLSEFGTDTKEFIYSIKQIKQDSNFKTSGTVEQFKYARIISELGLNWPSFAKDSEKRKAKLMDLVDAIFQPIDGFTTTSSMKELKNVQVDELVSVDVAIAETTSEGEYRTSGNGVYEMVGTGSQTDYSIELSSEEPMANAAINLKEISSETLMDNYEPAKLKAALVEMIETGNDNPENISISAVMDALYAFGGISSSASVNGFTVNHAMMGDVFSAVTMGANVDMNAQREGDRYTGVSVSFADLSVPAVAIASLPERVVPQNVSISYGLTHAPLPYYTDVIGRDNISALIKNEESAPMFLMQNLDGLLAGFNEGTFSPDMRIALSGEGYDFVADAKFEVDAAFDPEQGPVPNITGTVTVTGIDGLKAFIIGLSPDLSEEMQTGVFGAVGVLGIVESMADRQDDNSLVFNIEMTSMNEVTVNGNTFPLR